MVPWDIATPYAERMGLKVDKWLHVHVSGWADLMEIKKATFHISVNYRANIITQHRLPRGRMDKTVYQEILSHPMTQSHLFRQRGSSGPV